MGNKTPVKTTIKTTTIKKIVVDQEDIRMDQLDSAAEVWTSNILAIIKLL